MGAMTCASKVDAVEGSGSKAQKGRRIALALAYQSGYSIPSRVFVRPSNRGIVSSQRWIWWIGHNLVNEL